MTKRHIKLCLFIRKLEVLIYFYISIPPFDPHLTWVHNYNQIDNADAATGALLRGKK